MFKIPLPWPDTSLLMIPQFGWLPRWLQAALLILLCLAPIALIVWLYLYELRLVSPGTATGLLGLRLLVVVLLLCLIGLQPRVAHDPSIELRGRVLIAVDRSDSMEIADPQRTPEEKLRLAKALKLGGGLSDAQLDAWADDHAKGREPKWVGDDEARDDPSLRRELAAQRRAAHDKLLDEVDKQTRAAVSRRVLDESGVDLIRRLQARHDVELIGFHRDGWDLKPNQLDKLFAAPEPGKGDRLASRFTDLKVPLKKALERSAPGKVLGVIVLTDGQHNYGDTPSDTPSKLARELGDRSLPIFPVALGARKPPAAVAVTLVKGPSTVFKDVNAILEVRFKVTGLDKQEFLVEVHKAGDDKAAAQRIVRHDGQDREYTETFSIKMDQAGTQALTATVKPLGKPPAHTRLEGNRGVAVVNVADAKAKVLLIDGEAGWEYHYLFNALDRDRTIELETVVFEQPRLDPALSDADRKTMRIPKQQLPEGPHALDKFHCIILGDVTEAQLPLKDRQRLERFVGDQGKTLVILAGKRGMPLGFPAARPDGEADPLRKLLPIEIPYEAKPLDGFAVTRTAQGKETKFMDLATEPGESDKRWAELPRHYWGMIGKAKPGAVTLAYVPDPAADPKKPAPEVEKQRALFVRQNYGFGRVLYVGVDSTWRWRYKKGDEYHHSFWGQAIRWAASDKPLLVNNEFLSFGTPQPIFRPDEPVQVVVRLNEEAGPLKADLAAGARLIRLDGDKEEAVALMELNRREAEPRVLEGKMTGLPAGKYAVELVIPELADKVRTGAGEPGRPDKPLRAEFTQLPPESREMIDLETRWPLLQDLAGASGGKVFTPETAHELADLLAQQRLTEVRHSETALWQVQAKDKEKGEWRWQWPAIALLVTVAALLTLEWVGRKWSGLP